MVEVEKTILEWGKKVGLQENYIKSQLTWHKRQNKNMISMKSIIMNTKLTFEFNLNPIIILPFLYLNTNLAGYQF